MFSLLFYTKYIIPGGMASCGIIKVRAVEPWLFLLLFTGEKSSRRVVGWGCMDGPAWEDLPAVVFHWLRLREKMPTEAVPAIFSFAWEVVLLAMVTLGPLDFCKHFIFFFLMQSHSFIHCCH